MRIRYSAYVRDDLSDYLRATWARRNLPGRPGTRRLRA